jgi:hypothetical protein
MRHCKSAASKCFDALCGVLAQTFTQWIFAGFEMHLTKPPSVLYIRDLTDDIHYASVLETSSDRDERVCSSDRYDEILVSMLWTVSHYETCISVLATIFVPQANEMYFDLGGTLGFLSTTFVSLYYPSLIAKYWQGANILLPRLSDFAPRQLLLSAALSIWSIRLGSFLVTVRVIYTPRSFNMYSHIVQRALKAGGSDSRVTLH